MEEGVECQASEPEVAWTLDAHERHPVSSLSLSLSPRRGPAR